jgi:hypothetical protein
MLKTYYFIEALRRKNRLISLTEEQKSTFIKSSWLFKSLGFVCIYAIWVISVRFLALTIITYFTISPNSHFQDINDAFSSNEVGLMGLSAVLFLFLLQQLNPVTAISREEIITQEQIEKNFLPGFVRGAGLAGFITLIFVLAGVYRYLGYFIQLDEAPLELANVLLRMTALGSLAYCEEFIFRYKLSKQLQERLPDIVVANWIAFLYCGIKILQFDLGWMHILTLYLVSVALFYRSRNGEAFSRGAGIWAAVLIIFHPLLSLPIFGNNFSGMLLVKYSSSHPEFKLGSNSQTLVRLVTGGAGGPISSLTFQIILIIDIARSALKKSNFRLRSQPVQSSLQL